MGDLTCRPPYHILEFMNKKTFPARYAVPHIYNRINRNRYTVEHPLEVTVPGSKSITNRALLLATLAKGTSTLRGVLFSDDSRHFLGCIQDLGYETTVDEPNRLVTVKGMGGAIPRREASLYVGSAGTAARFLTAFLGISDGFYHMDASEQMCRRPMAPLLNSLRELGCEILPEQDSTDTNHFPFLIKSHGFGKNRIRVNIDHSSQFLSALLIASCLCDRDFTVDVEGTHGMAYIEMTCKMMEQFGVHTTRPLSDRFVTPAGQSYRALDYRIEPDVSAACYFYAMVPLLGIPVRVTNVHFDSLQGDVAFIRLLVQMGCQLSETESGILLLPPADNCFHGITADMSSCSDQAITLAAIAPFADTPTTITGIGHIRYQESDRIHAILTELSRLGIRCEETKTGVTIYPGTPTPGLVTTYEDHRMAMGFSLIGLRAEGIQIDNPACCTKTFEEYFDILDEIATSML